MDKPQYDGQCAFAVSLGKKAEGMEKHQIVKDGKIYYFSNAIAKFLFKILPGRLAKAEANWNKRI